MDPCTGIVLCLYYGMPSCSEHRKFWWRSHLAAHDIIALDATQQQTDIVASLPLVELLLKHLHARHGGLQGLVDAQDLYLIPRPHYALLHPPCHHCPTPLHTTHNESISEYLRLSEGGQQPVE